MTSADADAQRRPPIVVLSRFAAVTDAGELTGIRFTVRGNPTSHVALVRGDVTGDDILTRVHSECLTGDVFGSRRCDCGEQLAAAMSAVARARREVIVYLRGHEGRRIALVNKLRAYALQEHGFNTIQANLALGLAVDARSCDGAAGVLNSWMRAASRRSPATSRRSGHYSMLE